MDFLIPIPLLKRLVDKQFEIIGEKFGFGDIPEDSLITIDKKKIYWYHHYFFNTRQEYESWRKFLEDNLKDNLKWINYIDLRYGMTYRYKKEGLLF